MVINILLSIFEITLNIAATNLLRTFIRLLKNNFIFFNRSVIIIFIRLLKNKFYIFTEEF